MSTISITKAACLALSSLAICASTIQAQRAMLHGKGRFPLQVPRKIEAESGRPNGTTTVGGDGPIYIVQANSNKRIKLFHANTLRGTMSIIGLGMRPLMVPLSRAPVAALVR